MNGASVNTATATTATAERPAQSYTGRFAPSPTGPLHIGSLTTAVASYLEARSRQGRWLLRIEDLDTTRQVRGIADQMLRTLEQLGFEWDATPIFQSRRLDAYRAAEAELARRQLCYPCSCTRRTLAESEAGSAYPGTCRAGPSGAGPMAVRFRVQDFGMEHIDDQLRGRVQFRMADVGDPIIRRRDGIFAYQLAVVVDDAASGVSDVVRGADLLDSTGWQLHLGGALGYAKPAYCHLPLITDADRRKLSKSANAIPLDVRSSSRCLYEALRLLRQQPPPELGMAPPSRIWQWAIASWRLDALHEITSIPLAP